MPQNKNTVNYREFTGKNNVSDVERLKRDELRDAMNVDITDRKKLKRRTGFSKVYTGTDVHSLWANDDIILFGEDTSLKKLNNDYTAIVLRSGLSRNDPIAFCDADNQGDIYYSNSSLNGVLRNGISYAWGLPVPSLPVLSAAASGLFKAGTYQVTLTYRDAVGRESGAKKATTITLTDNQGITLSGIPVSTVADVETVVIYISPPDGDQLYYAGIVSNGTTATTLNSAVLSYPLRTMFVVPPPAGNIIFYHKGRMYVVVDDTIYYSDAYGLDRFYESKNYFRFPETITLAVPVEDGIYISSNRTYWIPTVNPSGDIALVEKSTARAIKGTAASVDASQIGNGGSKGPAWMWLSDQGVCIGGNSGAFNFVDDDRYLNEKASQGAAIFRELNGMNQYLALIKNNGESGNISMNDEYVSEIIRNGVTIT